MSTREILTRARKLITDRDRWIQLASAENADGERVQAGCDGAVKFCMLGAIDRVSTIADNPLPAIRYGLSCRGEAIRALYRALPGDFTECSATTNRQNIAEFNDSRERDHSEVLAVFDRAIAQAD